MKKLKLKLDGVKEMLTREQMKKVIGGGYGDAACLFWNGLGCNPCINNKCDPAGCFYSPGECPCTNEAPCPTGYTVYTCPDDSCSGGYDTLCRAPHDTDHC